MSNKTKCLCLAGILIVAGFFRFYHLATTPPGLFMDEAMDGVNAQNVAQTGQFKVYYPEDNGREGLYVNILAIAFKYHLLPETAPWSVRFPAAVAGFLTVVGVYLMVGELFKESYEVRGTSYEQEQNKKTHTSYLIPHSSWLALLSAFFLATSFWHINFSRIGFRAILAPFCLVWAIYFLLKAIRSKSATNYWLLATAAGIIYGLGFYTYIAFRITPLLLLLFIPFFRKTPDFWKKIGLFLVVTFLVALPIGWYYLHNPADFFGRTSQISIASSGNPIVTVLSNTLKTALMFNWHGDYNWRQNISGSPELWWPVGILFLIGIIISIVVTRRYYRKNPKSQIPSSKQIQNPNEKKSDPERSNSIEIWDLGFGISFIFLWFILGALPEILSDEGIPHALRSLLMVVPTMIFAAIGTLWLYQWLARKLSARWMKAISIIFVGAIIAGAYWQYFIAWAENPNVPGAFNANYVAIGQEINALPPATQKYVVIYAGGVVDYGLPMPVEPVLYITNSFIPNTAAQKVVNNTHYLLPDEVSEIPQGTPSSTIFEIR